MNKPVLAELNKERDGMIVHVGGIPFIELTLDQAHSLQVSIASELQGTDQ